MKPKKEEIVNKIISKILVKLRIFHETANIIHHDLKPQNILISNGWNPIQTDFDVFMIDYGFSESVPFNTFIESDDNTGLTTHIERFKF